MNLDPIKKRNIIIGDSINNENYIGKPLYLYQIRNKINSMKYIGISYRIDKRIEEHLKKLKKGDHVCEDFQADFNKFGEESFVFEVIFETAFVSSDQKALIERLAILTMNNLYNVNQYKFKTKVSHKKRFIVNNRNRVINPYKGLEFNITLEGRKIIRYDELTPSYLNSKNIKSFKIFGIKEIAMLSFIRNRMYRDFNAAGEKLTTKYSEVNFVLYCNIITPKL